MVASFDAEEAAELLLLCVAELEPPDTLPPATDTGTLAFTPFWLALADEPALCVVLALCDALWACPEPPQPTAQPELLVCDWLELWVVEALFEADELAELLLLCEAEGSPLPLADPAVSPPTETPPPLTVTGTLALTAFWSAVADELDSCAVSEDCVEDWAWPAPPQPATQLDEPADCD